MRLSALLGRLSETEAFARVARAVDAGEATIRLHGLEERAAGILESFVKGLDVLRNPGEVVTVSLLSLCIWASLALSVVPAFWSLSMQFGWYYPALVLILAGFGMLIPTPAGTGTVHYALGVLFPAITGIPEYRAKAFAIIFHTSQFLPIIVAGIVAALKEGVDVGRVDEVVENEPGAPE